MELLTWEIATGKPPFPSRLTQAAAFLRNDQPGGLAVILNMPTLESEQNFKQDFDIYLRYWVSRPTEHEATLNHYMGQLEDYAKCSPSDKENVETGVGVILILNTMWLVWTGRIKNDEYNGTAFIWEMESMK